VLGGRHSGHAVLTLQRVAPQANRPTFAGESRRKCPRSRSGLLEWWVFGKSQVLLRRAIVAVSLVMGRGGSGRCGFGCWVARVSAGALQPESDSRVSAVFATCRGPKCRSERGDSMVRPLRARHASRTAHRFLEVSPRSRGKDELRQGQRPATDFDFGRTSQAARFRSLVTGLPLASVGGASSRMPRFRHHLARGATGRPSA